MIKNGEIYSFFCLRSSFARFLLSYGQLIIQNTNFSNQPEDYIIQRGSSLHNISYKRNVHIHFLNIQDLGQKNSALSGTSTSSSCPQLSQSKLQEKSTPGTIFPYAARKNLLSNADMLLM